MDRVRLFYKDMGEIIGGDGCSVIRLVDEAEQRSLCFICDKHMADQLTMRLNSAAPCYKLLPEVLLGVLTDESTQLEITIYGIMSGEYLVGVENKATSTFKPIRMSDAVLLHYIAKVPLYIMSSLMDTQSTAYVPNPVGLSVPINTLETKRLQQELERAVDEEDYRKASLLHEELQKRQEV